MNLNEPIGKETTTLDVLAVQHPWLVDHIKSWEAERNRLEAENERLHVRKNAQKRELRRLNHSIVDKLHRLREMHFRLQAMQAVLEIAGIKIVSFSTKERAPSPDDSEAALERLFPLREESTPQDELPF